MSLQTALVAIGVFLIASVYLVTKWTEKRRSDSEAQNFNAKNAPGINSLDEDTRQEGDIPSLGTPLHRESVESGSDGLYAYIDHSAIETAQDNTEFPQGEMLDDQSEDDGGDQEIETLEDIIEQRTDERNTEDELDDYLAIHFSDQIDELGPAPYIFMDAEEVKNGLDKPQDLEDYAKAEVFDWDELIHKGEELDSESNNLEAELSDQTQYDNSKSGSGGNGPVPIDLIIDIERSAGESTGTTNVTSLSNSVGTESASGKSRRIEPKLTQYDEIEKEMDVKAGVTPTSEQLSPDNSDTGAASSYAYPDIQGFDRVSQIDYWAKIFGERDVGRESVLGQYREAISSLGKASRIYGLKIPEKNWCDLEQESEESRFADLVITVQLADQRGAIKENELLKFSELVSNLAVGTGREFVMMAELESALQQAKLIFEFIQYYDSVFVVNIAPDRAEKFSGGEINRCAAQLGLEQNKNSYFVRNKTVGKDKVCLYSLANMSDSGKFDFDNLKDLTTPGVTFFTKPAVNRSPGAVFAEMVDTAKAFAARVKGEAIFPEGGNLSQEDVDRIRKSIEMIAQEMEDLGISPGCEEAKRIF